MSLDHQTRSEIQFDIDRITAILDYDIFRPSDPAHPLFNSALTELLISVRDLLAKAKKYATRVSFTDDVIVMDDVKDVSGLIKFLRDALCHVNSKKHHDHAQLQARISRNVAFRKIVLLDDGKVRIESQYDDDVAFFFGPQRIYLHRHIIRAYKEAVALLRPLM